MPRLNLTELPIEETTSQTNEELDTLVNRYASNKELVNKYSKLCDVDNSKIKSIMRDSGIDSYATSTYTVKYSVTKTEKLDQDKILETVKELNIPDVIETKEYVNLDKLEKYLYNSNDSTILDKINKLGIGPGGLGGTTTALAVNINTYPTHIAGLPVAVNICCHVNRHAVRII